MTVHAELAELRLLIAFLGEKEQFGWWDTDFLSPNGLEFLAYNFPRTAMLAGLQGASEAGKRLHDERIGIGRVFHLFRLPTQLEERIHRIVRDGEVPSDALTSKDAAMERLGHWIDAPVSAPEGPIQIGTEARLNSKFSLTELAKHYSDAFRAEKQTFPYFKAADA